MKAAEKPADEALVQADTLRLSAAFVEDVQRREAVLAIWGLLETLSDIPARVSEPLLGDIRYTWWLEAITEISEGRKVRYHPVSAALEAAFQRFDLEADVFVRAIEAQRIRLDEGRLSLKAALGLVDGADVALGRCAARILWPDANEAALQLLVAPVRFYALAQLRSLGAIKPDEVGESEYRHLYREARQAMRKLAPVLMPLALPAAFAGDIWQARPIGPLKRRLRLLWVFVSGRI